VSPADAPLQGEPFRTAAAAVLQQTALASGLLSRPQLDDALSGLLVTSAGVPRSAAEIPDAELADRLVAMGYLNRWQVEQLCEGHTKFRLGPYRIVDAIGKGGMGHVFKGEHELLGRIEAVKVLPRSKSTPEAIAAFQREMRVQAQLDHPNLVRISYADRDGDTYFFVTEYVPGTDLRRLVRRHGPLPATIAASIIAQAAEGLHYAHRRGLVHRDIKPGNLLVTPDGRTKLTDLGLAWFLMDDLGPVAGAKSGTIVGTADYLAPENIAEPDKVRPVSDIYSLGCTFYYAVTGKVPFPGGKSSDKIRRHLTESPLNPLHFNPDLPREVCDLIAHMMDKNPETRLPTAAAVAERLRPWCSGQLPSDLAALVEQTSVESIRQRPTAASNPVLADTAGYDVDDLPEALPGQGERFGEDIPSQLSQSTDPISAATEDTQETMSDRLNQASDENRVKSGRFWPPLLVLLIIFVALALFLWGPW
jgi:serine/threonine protein kinase